jgi:isopentenyl-diphosphate delta-isomerase
MHSHSNRKRDHIDICLGPDIEHASSSGFDAFQFLHVALPEIDFEDIELQVNFLGHDISAPLFISGMTGGINDAVNINGELAELCSDMNIPFVLGSQRSMLHDLASDESFTIARKRAPNGLISANIGATEIAYEDHHDGILSIIDRIEANFLTIHANPLQELFQPEGNTRFSGVLRGIERIRERTDIPIIVKEVGSGISLDIAKKLHDIGVDAIDVAGKGGTSWSAVEMKRNQSEFSEYFREWGMPTSYCLLSLREYCGKVGMSMMSSGGIRNTHDIAMSIAMGAKSVGMARPILLEYHENGVQAVQALLEDHMKNLKRIMFLTGSKNCNQLSNAMFRKV